MRLEVFLPLALLFLAHGVPSKAQTVERTGAGTVTVRVGAPLTVECWVRVEQPLEWRLEGRAVPADMSAASEVPTGGGRLAARLHAAAARPHHAGTYTCSRDSDTDPGAPGQRIRVLVTSLPPAPGPAGDGEASTAAATVAATVAGAGAGAGPALGAGLLAGAEEEDDKDLVLYDVGRKFALNCTPPGLADTSKLSYVWKKNGTAVERVELLKDRYTVEEGVFRMTKRTLEDDFGNYTCEPSGLPSVTFRVHGCPYAKVDRDTNVIEENKLKIVCTVTGKPHPAVEWTFSNDTAEGNGTVQQVFGTRVTLAPNEQGVLGALLEMELARPSDAGNYTCWPLGRNTTAASTIVRVKDKYAALWPFLGICAEVFVLCAIILVYEKRRTKPELDDSDTDNHDQKKS